MTRPGSPAEEPDSTPLTGADTSVSNPVQSPGSPEQDHPLSDPGTDPNPDPHAHPAPPTPSGHCSPPRLRTSSEDRVLCKQQSPHTLG